MSPGPGRPPRHLPRPVTAAMRPRARRFDRPPPHRPRGHPPPHPRRRPPPTSPSAPAPPAGEGGGDRGLCGSGLQGGSPGGVGGRRRGREGVPRRRRRRRGGTVRSPGHGPYHFTLHAPGHFRGESPVRVPWARWAPATARGGLGDGDGAGGATGEGRGRPPITGGDGGEVPGTPPGRRRGRGGGWSGAGGDGEGRPHAFAWPPRLACEVGLRMYGHTKRGRPRGAFVPAAAARSDRVQPASEDI